MNQDFVIEDMKIMVHNMSENIDRMVELTNGKEEEEEEVAVTMEKGEEKIEHISSERMYTSHPVSGVLLFFFWQ